MAPLQQPLIDALATSTLAEDVDPGVEQVLDAALAQFEDLGIRRSTIEDIARRAGIDRVTVYRRVGSKDDVIQAVITREARKLIDHVTSTTAPLETLEDRIATGFATAIVQVRTNALFNRMLALEGDTVLPRLTTHAAPLLTIGIAAAVMLLEQAQTDRLLDPIADPHAVAEILVRLVLSFILTPQGTVKLQNTAELEAFARAHVAPIATRSSSPGASHRV
jgi:AcrR family transcriptional regulator